MIIPFREKGASFRLVKCTKGLTAWSQIDEKIGMSWCTQQQFPLDQEAQARERFEFLVSELKIEVLEEK